MQNTRFCANKSGIAGAIPLAYPKSRSFSRPQARIKCKSVLSGGVYIGQNTLRTASVEFVRKQRTNYARRRAQPFQTRTQPRGSRLRACQKDFLTSSSVRQRCRTFLCSLVSEKSHTGGNVSGGEVRSFRVWLFSQADWLHTPCGFHPVYHIAEGKTINWLHRVFSFFDKKKPAGSSGGLA